MLEKVWDNNKTTLNTVPTTSSGNKSLLMVNEPGLYQLDKKNDKLIEMIVQTVFKNRR